MGEPAVLLVEGKDELHVFSHLMLIAWVRRLFAIDVT